MKNTIFLFLVFFGLRLGAQNNIVWHNQTFELLNPSILFESGGNGTNNDFYIKSGGTNGRTRLFVLPSGTSASSQLAIFNSSDVSNAGTARLAGRNDFGLLQLQNVGTPATAFLNFAIELDPQLTSTGERFLITTNGFNSTGSPTTLFELQEDGRASFPSLGIYDDDAGAATGGVQVGEMYELSATNTYSLPEGTLKVRRS